MLLLFSDITAWDSYIAVSAHILYLEIYLPLQVSIIEQVYEESLFPLLKLR